MQRTTKWNNRFLQTIVAAVFAVAMPVLSIDSATTAPKQPFQANIGGSLRMPILSASTHWKPYPTAGITIVLPSTVSWLSCSAGGEAGRIVDTSGELSIQCIHLRFGIIVKSIINHPLLQIRPEAGLLSMMVGSENDDIDLAHSHFFKKVENEYGLYGGIEPRLLWKKFRFSLPIRIERIFSSPERFDALIISGLAGYQFDL